MNNDNPTNENWFEDTEGWATSLSEGGILRPTSHTGLHLNRLAEVVSSKLPDSPYCIQGGNGFDSAWGFQWNSGDNNCKYWRPQGITGVRFDHENGHTESAFVLVSWYNTDNKGRGARVTYVDVKHGNIVKHDGKYYRSYRHALLVEEDDDATKQYKALAGHPHAGGIAYHKGHLFVAQTSAGIRVYDALNPLEGVEPNPSKDKCGVIDGKAYAYNYGAILPQTRYYNEMFSLIQDSVGVPSTESPKAWAGFSFISMIWAKGERTSTQLLSGCYINSSRWSDGKRPALFLWDLDEDGYPVETENPTNILAGLDDDQLEDYMYMQGATINGNRLWLSRSGSDGGVYYRDLDSDDAPTKAFGMESGIPLEDLHLGLHEEYLFGLDEGKKHSDESDEYKYYGNRVVFALTGI